MWTPFENTERLEVEQSATSQIAASRTNPSEEAANFSEGHPLTAAMRLEIELWSIVRRHVSVIAGTKASTPLKGTRRDEESSDSMKSKEGAQWKSQILLYSGWSGHSRMCEKEVQARGIPGGCWIQKTWPRYCRFPGLDNVLDLPWTWGMCWRSDVKEPSGKYPCEPMGPAESGVHSYMCYNCLPREKWSEIRMTEIVDNTWRRCMPTTEKILM
jgi:hypothetical protein